MSHPRIEEVDDSDVSDPSEGDIADFSEADILRRVEPASSRTSAPPAAARPGGSGGGGGGGPKTHPSAQFLHPTADASQWAGCQALYPVYFDADRSRAEGRRVARSKAVRNPLAREMVNACAALGLRTLFEPTKTHPKDWANPGRVKVDLASGGGRGVKIQNKHHLYVLVADHLAAHPVADDAAPVLREPMKGGPPPPPAGKPYPRPAVPRGWKVGEFLPYYSPALTGGGVSENLFRDMMKEMQGGGDMASMLQAAAAGGGAGGPSGSGGGGGGADGGGTGKKGKKGKGKG